MNVIASQAEIVRRAMESAKTMGADAFAVGKHLFFSKEKFSTTSAEEAHASQSDPPADGTFPAGQSKQSPL